VEQLRIGFRKKLEKTLNEWHLHGVPPRYELRSVISDLRNWRENVGVSSLWDQPPLMVSATLDDGWGLGIETIESCARAVGICVYSIGLMIPAQDLIRTCHEMRPDLLALTMLHSDTEPVLEQVCTAVAGMSRVVVGGAGAAGNPRLEQRLDIMVAKDISDFLELLLSW